jgi:hypothetical protein
MRDLSALGPAPSQGHARCFPSPSQPSSPPPSNLLFTYSDFPDVPKHIQIYSMQVDTCPIPKDAHIIQPQEIGIYYFTN